jgi:hypothetical protein
MAAELEEIENWLIDVPEDGDGLTIKDLQDLWGLARTTAAARAEWLADKGRMRHRKDRIPGNNAMRNLYWAIPAVYPTHPQRRPRSGHLDEA